MLTQNNGGLFFAGLVMGGLVGASLALLLAPQSGEATRDRIRDKSLELKDGTVEGLTEAVHYAQVQSAVWQEKGQEVVKKRKRNITEVISFAKESVIQAES